VTRVEVRKIEETMHQRGGYMLLDKKRNCPILRKGF